MKEMSVILLTLYTFGRNVASIDINSDIKEVDGIGEKVLSDIDFVLFFCC